MIESSWLLASEIGCGKIFLFCDAAKRCFLAVPDSLNQIIFTVLAESFLNFYLYFMQHTTVLCAPSMTLRARFVLEQCNDLYCSNMSIFYTSNTYSLSNSDHLRTEQGIHI